MDRRLKIFIDKIKIRFQDGAKAQVPLLGFCSESEPQQIYAANLNEYWHSLFESQELREFGDACGLHDRNPFIPVPDTGLSCGGQSAKRKGVL